MTEEILLTKKELCASLKEKCSKFGLTLIEIKGENDESSYFHPVFQLDKDFTLTLQHDVESARKDIMGFYGAILGKGGALFPTNLYNIDKSAIIDFVRDFEYLKPKILSNISRYEAINDLKEELNALESKISWDFSKKEEAEDTLKFLKSIKKAENFILSNKKEG